MGENMKPADDCTVEGLVMPPLNVLFPFDYQGGGYFRRKGVPKGISADILHAEQAVQFLYDEIKRHNNTRRT
jgi:hypothetical protein